MHSQHITRLVASAGLLVALGVIMSESSQAMANDAPYETAPEAIWLGGTLRDFTSAHPDFGFDGSETLGQYAGLVGKTLGSDGKPVSSSPGYLVGNQWYDLAGKPIMPYGEPGLAGGHFDVDVYDTYPSIKELYHEHKYDDKYNVTALAIVSDTRLLFENVVGSAYPNPIRVEFLNPHNGGGGSYRFETTSSLRTGVTADGFTDIFMAADLLDFTVQFISLADMRKTQPGNSQDDAIDRDDAFAMRMYDTVSGQLIYELASYHHYKAKDALKLPTPIPPIVGVDTCGDPVSDTVGSYDSVGTGEITSSASFNQWFNDVPGVNASKKEGVVMQRNANGVYEFNSSSFFPADGQLYGNEGGAHNETFTFSTDSKFVYSACTDQFIDVAASDDVWVFINGQLVIDLGGLGTGTNQTVALDRLGLTDGQEYTMQMFYARRRPSPTSIFNVRTNIPLIMRRVHIPVSAYWD